MTVAKVAGLHHYGSTLPDCITAGIATRDDGPPVAEAMAPGRPQ